MAQIAGRFNAVNTQSGAWASTKFPPGLARHQAARRKRRQLKPIPFPRFLHPRLLPALNI